jgi:ABC-2 type transport system permease protein
MNPILITARYFCKQALTQRSFYILYALFLTLALFAVATAYRAHRQQNAIRTAYQQKARQSWEANPDKHPHRMAHFGSFAFRHRHPLSLFDNGMENYTGNAVYLEAHKQNTVNFSEAGFSTGLLRFGDLTPALLLYLVLPLLLFFMGFGTIAQQRENGTLKILLVQGAGFKQLIWGNGLGLFAMALLFALPVLAICAATLPLQPGSLAGANTGGRAAIAGLAYLLYLAIVCLVAVCLSALVRNGKAALLSLLGLWLLMGIVLPKTLQAVGSYLHPAPGKIVFEAAVENEIVQLGDSHNPNDPHYKRLKDSVLKAHGADSVQQLPFNYSGFQMREGERLSAEVYNRHLDSLYQRYQRQNSWGQYAALANPLAGIRHLSMALCGTDLSAYRHFQQQAEAYRYQLAQTMNELQMQHISNKRPGPGDKPHTIGRHHWQEFPDFAYRFQPLSAVLRQQWPALLSLALWALATVGLVRFASKKAKAI